MQGRIGVVKGELAGDSFSDQGDRMSARSLYWFERPDIFNAKAVFGEWVCIRGNVPASLLCTGTPQKIRDYCKKLIDVVGKGGGFITDGDIGITDAAKAENVRAMIDYTKSCKKV